MAQSTDTGKTFESPTNVTDAITNFSQYGLESFFGDYFMTVQDLDFTHAVWSDGRAMNGPKIYFAKLSNGSTSSIQDLKLLGDYSLKVFPVPASKKLNIELKCSISTNIKIRIIDINGQEVFHEEARVLNNQSNQLILDISSLPPALYFLNICGQDINEIRRIMVK